MLCRGIAFARADALLQVPALHGVAREAERVAEMFVCDLAPAGAKLELAQRRKVEGIGGEALAVGDRADLLEAALGTLMLSDSNGPVERDDRGRANRHQRVVEGHDDSPIGLLQRACARVDRRDRGLY